MKRYYADLHVHTNYSDSTFSPEEVIQAAMNKDIDSIAVTDHDCVGGIPFCIEYGRDKDIEVIPGVEVTAEKETCEIHILGLFIDWETGWFMERLEQIQKSRTARMYKMIGLLGEHGIEIDPEAVFQISGNGSIGRLHLAYAMLNTKKVKTIREAFNKYIGYKKPCYVAYKKFSPREAVETIMAVGGVPVVAHPAIMRDDEVISELVGYGLRGIEVYHPDHSLADEKKYARMANEKGLLVTGGSDCHGLGKGKVLMGSVRIEYSLVEKLREEAGNIKKNQL